MLGNVKNDSLTVRYCRSALQLGAINMNFTAVLKANI